jgi:stage II sporulation protein D
MRISILLIIIVFLIAYGPSTKASQIEFSDNINVIVGDNTKEIDLSVKGPYDVMSQTGEVLKTGQTFFNIRIIPTPSGISFGKYEFKENTIEIIPRSQPALYIGKCLYDGTLQIMKDKRGLLKAVNILDLEEYLKGVLYHEVSHRWPMEVIKAQAIASRTFALYQMQQGQGKVCYLKDDVNSQMYRGVYAHRYRTNKAIEQTKGEILVYKGKLIPAFFHATCGGKTEASSQLWDINITPLTGVNCLFCQHSPHLKWRYDISIADLENKFKEAGYNFNGISDITIEKLNLSGRVISLMVRARNGIERISGKEFRYILGSRNIRSTNFTIFIKDDIVRFEGKGWGHGVGLCQWGAFTMAKKGKTATEILTYYYPGAEIVTLNHKV